MFAHGAATTPLKLLRRIRDVMASAATAQKRLDRLVKIIAEGLNADVCSVYLMRAGDLLELFATCGLHQQSVHQTRLNIGEGLVGEIASSARPLKVWDAKNHPSYVYRPETGEELYDSFLGVPILRHGRVIGVLVIQNKKGRQYSENEVELLLTVAMVLAELAGGGELIEREELHKGAGSNVYSKHLTGSHLSPGMGIGVAVLHEPHIVIRKVVAEDTGKELERFDAALEAMQQSVDELVDSVDFATGGEQQAIMEAYKMFARDKGWVNRIREIIETGLTAEAAVKRAEEELRLRMSQSNNPYLRDRLHDIEDLGNRLLEYLMGSTAGFRQDEELPESFILVARSMSPAELLDYDRSRLSGLVLEEGGGTSHIVIIAKAMDLPVVGSVENGTMLIDQGDPLIIDGGRGEVFVRPGDEIREEAEHYQREREQRRAKYRAMRDQPARTKDGTDISLSMNAGLFVDLSLMHDLGADGIGLYRTELPYMLSPDFPEVEEQADMYAHVLDEAEGKRVVFRSFDIGGDKQVPYFPIPNEDNPAMGWRATRIALDRPFILRRQFKALLQAAAGRELDLMFPFISEVAEYDAVRGLFRKEYNKMVQAGERMPQAIRLGTMLEIPSLLWQLDTLLPRLDFISVGSNDLAQFLFACDRGNPKLADRYDPLNPAMIAVIRQIVEACDRHEVTLGFCGEMAGRPLEAMALIGLGITHLSMPPSSLGPVKEMICSLSYDSIREMMGALQGSSERSLRGRLENYARDHQVVL